jgi:hypothetical protein
VFGPWSRNISDSERVARLRSMRALALVFARSRPDFAAALLAAEKGDERALDRALKLLDTLPAIGRRQMLCTYNDLRRASYGRATRRAPGRPR